MARSRRRIRIQALDEDGKLIPHFSLSRKSANKRVDSGLWYWCNEFTIRMRRIIKKIIGGFWDGPLGVGNLAPFSRVPNKMQKPPSINYPIPACGARERIMFVRKVNYIPESWQ